MEQKKLLVQSQGSPADPKYSDMQILYNGNNISFYDFFREHGIMPLKEDLVNSCHGNTQMTLELAHDIQELADQGHKIVCYEQGGLYFAKPSLEAANMPTVPVISVPLDSGMFDGLDAFLAPQIPTGTAVIAGVGVGRYDTAANVARDILCNEYKGVYIEGDIERGY